MKEAQLSLFDATVPVQPAAPRSAGGTRELRIGAERIGWTLRRARRRTIGFSVGADGLAVSAPRWVGIAEIESALHEKGGWIVRKLREARERERRIAAARIDWRDGASLPFLGADIAIRLDGRRAAPMLDADTRTLHLALPTDAAPAQIRDAARAWLQRQARRLFEQRCAEYAPRLGVTMTSLSLGSAATRWGSAGIDGSIRLNWRLMHLPLPLIDYVVVHELSHLREMNHGARFWNVVRSVLPGFQSARIALRDPPLPTFD